MAPPPPSVLMLLLFIQLYNSFAIIQHVRLTCTCLLHSIRPRNECFMFRKHDTSVCIHSIIVYVKNKTFHQFNFMFSSSIHFTFFHKYWNCFFIFYDFPQKFHAESKSESKWWNRNRITIEMRVREFFCVCIVSHAEIVIPMEIK